MKRISFLIAFASLMLLSFGLAQGQSPGEIYLDNVTGILGSATSDTVEMDAEVKFTLALRMDHDSNLVAFTLGFQVYTALSDANPATAGYFDAITYDSITIPDGWLYFPPYVNGHFDQVFFNESSIDGQGRDTIGFSALHTTAGSQGFPTGWDTPFFYVTTTAHTNGDTLCIDSSFFPPGGGWIWSMYPIVTPSPQPDWFGPYCFYVHDPTQAPASLEVTPKKLSFSAIEGGSNPSSKTFSIGSDGDPLDFTLSKDSAWLSIAPSSGTTDANITVSVNISGLAVGTYIDTITVTSTTAQNSPQYVEVKLLLGGGATEIVLDDVTNLLGGPTSDTIGAGKTARFTFRLTNAGGQNLFGMTNGFVVYEKNGGNFYPITGDTLASVGFKDRFDLVFMIQTYSTDGMGGDTIGFGGAVMNGPGIENGFSEQVWWIETGSDNVGDTLCIDSSFFPPSGQWIWGMESGPPIIPDWGGPYCFHVEERPLLLDVDPDTLRFEANEGGGNPDPKYFMVSELSGAAIPYAVSESSSWFDLDKLGGTTPESVSVSVDISGISAGSYTDFIEITAPDAINSPQHVTVILDVIVPYDSGYVIHPTNEWINIYCPYPELDGVPLASGDVIVAYDPDGVPCGIDTVRQDGSYGLMPIYRDDIYSELLDEGAEPGDTIAFTINGQEVFVDPPVIWTENGDNYWVCDFTANLCVEIYLHEGWNLISWNVAYSDNIWEIVRQLGRCNCLEVVLSFDRGALTYDPNLVEFSTLQEVDYYHGYWFKLRQDAPWPIEICAPPISSEEGIGIYRGWNLVSYWPDETYSTEEGFASILEHLIVALGYDYGGLVWVPGEPAFNTLTELNPLFGYWVKSTEDDILSYPGFIPLPAPKSPGGSQVAANEVEPSRTWMSLYGSGITLDGVELPSSSIIEAYTSDGVRCGSSQYVDGLLKFTPVYGYDQMSEMTSEYPNAGDLVTLYVNGTRVYPDVEWTDHGDRVRIEQLYSAASGTGLVPDNYALMQNYPNPFNPSTEISFQLPDNSHVSLEIFNVLGQRVTTLANGVLEAGEHVFIWDGTDANGNTVSSGIYLYRLKAGDFVDTKKMVLMK